MKRQKTNTIVENTFRLYAYRRSTMSSIMKDFDDFITGAIEAKKLKQDSDIVYVTYGEYIHEFDGEYMFIPTEEKFWN